MMIQPDEFLAAQHIIRGLPRPNQCLAVFTHALAHVQPNTGRVMTTGTAIAAAIGTQPANVSLCLTALCKAGLLWRQGARGRPEFHVLPSVAWRGNEDQRLAALAAHRAAVQSNNVVAFRIVPEPT